MRYRLVGPVRKAVVVGAAAPAEDNRVRDIAPGSVVTLVVAGLVLVAASRSVRPGRAERGTVGTVAT